MDGVRRKLGLDARRSPTPRNIRSACTELVLRGIFLFDQYEIDWLYKEGGASSIYPDEWEEFASIIPESERGDLIEAYRKRLTSDDPDEQLRCAKAWSKWEAATVTLLPEPEVDRAFHQPRHRDRRGPDRKSLHGQQGLARGRSAAARTRSSFAAFRA